MKTQEQAITFNGLKSLLPILIPLVLILVTLIGAWFTISFQNSSNSLDIKDLKTNQEKLNDQQNKMNDQLTRLATIIDIAEKRGEISFKTSDGKAFPTPTLADSITPTPSFSHESTPDVTFNTYTDSGKSAQAQSTPTPSPTITPPTQTLPTPSIMESVLSAVSGLLK